MGRRVGYGTFKAEDGSIIKEQTNARKIERDGKVYLRQKKEGYVSRAARLQKAIEGLQEVADSIRDEGSDLEDRINAFDSLDYSEIEDLASEMENWKDLIPENLQSSDKYYAVEEAYDLLQNAVDTLSGLGAVTMDSEQDRLYYKFMEIDPEDITEKLQEQFNSLVEDVGSELESLADDIDSVIGDLEGVEFPGMFG